MGRYDEPHPVIKTVAIGACLVLLAVAAVISFFLPEDLDWDDRL